MRRARNTLDTPEKKRAAAKEYARQWRLQNPEKVREAKKRYRQKDGIREKEREDFKRWGAANQDRLRELWRASYARHAEKRRAYRRERNRSHPEVRMAWNEANREKMNAQSRQWQKDNRERALASTRNYNAKKRGANGVATAEQVEARMAFYGHQCAYCSGPFEHVDHVIAISRGGTNWPANLRPACSPCNVSKGAKPLAQWLARRATRVQLEQRAA